MPPRMARSPPWSDLPPELLILVFLRLPKRADRALFTAVCRTWCSAARHCRLPPPSPVPWLVLPDGSATRFPRGETFQLPDGMRHHTSCGEGLLLSRRDGSCFLMDHFTKATMPLPSLSSYSYYQEPVDVPEEIVPMMPWTWRDMVICKDEISVLSLVVCSTHLIAAILADGNLGTIAVCRPGAAAWSVSAHGYCMLFSHMVLVRGKLYALVKGTVGPEDHLIAIDIVDGNNSDEPRVCRMESLIEINLPPRTRACYVHYYLVESHGSLLMIRRNYFYKKQQGILVAGSNKFEVFEADFEKCLWAEVRTLGYSQELFLGQRYSRAVHVSPYDVSRDCVFFLNDYINWYSKFKGETLSCGLYDMRDEKIYFPLPMVSWRSGKVPATWMFSQGGTDEAAS